jgi:hypothetical protein
MAASRFNRCFIYRVNYTPELDAGVDPGFNGFQRRLAQCGTALPREEIRAGAEGGGGCEQDQQDAKRLHAAH